MIQKLPTATSGTQAPLKPANITSGLVVKVGGGAVVGELLETHPLAPS